MKRNNPETPILIREASGIAPRVWARYEWGREEVRELDGEFQLLYFQGEDRALSQRIFSEVPRGGGDRLVNDADADANDRS